MASFSVLLKSPDSNENTMSGLPLLVGFFVYAAVAISLYVETGDPHIGQSWPVLWAVAAVLLGVAIEYRYKEWGDE